MFSLKFTHFFVEFCRDRRLRAFVKILARSLFSFPCLSQNLSNSPAVKNERLEEAPAGVWLSCRVGEAGGGESGQHVSLFDVRRGLFSV